MLPSSHFLLIDDPPAGRDGRQREAQTRIGSPADARVVEGQTPAPTAQGLANAFADFMAASSRLENSYHDLQQEVAELKVELSLRRAALKRSQTENERMRLTLQQILDSMPCGVLVVDGERRIAMINPEARRLLEAGAVVMPDDAENLQQLSKMSGIDLAGYAAVEQGGETTREFCVRNADAVRWLEVRNRRIVDSSSESSGQTILILRDVTAHKRAEEERDAGRNAMARAELAGVLAHEIRNPLASLELFSELIEKDEKGRSQWISHLRAGLRSLSATVNNVLSFQGGELELRPVALGPAIENALDFVRPLVAQADISLEAPAADEPAWILGNRAALQQLILNLASNAVRHTQPGGRITVSVARCRPAEGRDSSEVAVEFADSGLGIAPEQLEEIFAPGFSGTGETPGLGLAVCRRIMERHGGRIAAANSKDGGARFSLRFPLIEAESEKP